MRQGKKLTRNRKVLVESVGLNSLEWRYYFEDKQYLHILSTLPGKREIKIIDKEIRKVLEPSKANQD